MDRPDDGPEPLSVGVFQAFRGKMQAGRQELFASNPLADFVVGFHAARLRIELGAVQ